MDDKTYVLTRDEVGDLLYLLDTLRDYASGRIDFDDLVLTNCYLYILDAMLTENGSGARSHDMEARDG